MIGIVAAVLVLELAVAWWREGIPRSSGGGSV